MRPYYKRLTGDCSGGDEFEDIESREGPRRPGGCYGRVRTFSRFSNMIGKITVNLQRTCRQQPKETNRVNIINVTLHEHLRVMNLVTKEHKTRNMDIAV